MLIVFCGKKRSGKDTAMHYMITQYGFKPAQKLAQPIKDIAKLLFGWSDDMVEGVNYDREQIIPELGLSVRQFLQECGSIFKFALPEALPESEAKLGAKVWVKLFVKWLQQQNTNDNFVLSDMRFPEEARELRELFPDTLIIRVESERSPVDTHISETSVNNIVPDYIIYNPVNKPDDLFINIDLICKAESIV